MKVIISGGGTGGHIYPAIAIADEIKRRDGNAEIMFVGAKGKMEMERVPKAGYPIEGLWISGIQRKWSLTNLVVPFKLISSLYRSNIILKNFKPDIAIGVGGYASGPLLRMAAKRNIRTLIQEQNSYAGLTNRLLSKHVNKICCAYEKMDRFFPLEKIELTGNPVRSDIINLKEKKEAALRFFEWGENKKTILMFGGSLGARTLNESMLNAKTLIEKNSDILFVWQTGKLYFEEMKNNSIAQLDNVRVVPFIEHMDLAYALADVIIARAGALTIAELCIVAKPAVLVPSPNVAEDHQTKNAEALRQKNAAILIKDSDAKNVLISRALELLKDEKKCNELASNIGKLALPKATKSIVDIVEKLIK